MSGVKHTPGPWRLVIDDTGGQWSGWPLCVCPVNDDDRSIVRTGGMWPYEWDAATSQREAVANARLIAAAPDLLEACVEAAKTFRRYEALHLDKGTVDGAQKAAANASQAKSIEAIIARARGEQSPSHSDQKEVGNV